MNENDRLGTKLAWQKAQRSVSNGACVEVARLAGSIVVRSSRQPDGPTLSYSQEEWISFVDGVKNGEFDHLTNA
ncbi:MAG: DUF397 domain-containing protein [Actinobacteria bacterium]|nr:DUF397 domain-containing protein [Actinomycetota bacterium]MBI3686423.1 DUF397 domain-containing protein [Actinomycetota bacterium]